MMQNRFNKRMQGPASMAAARTVSPMARMQQQRAQAPQATGAMSPIMAALRQRMGQSSAPMYGGISPPQGAPQMPMAGQQAPFAGMYGQAPQQGGLMAAIQAMLQQMQRNPAGRGFYGRG